MTALDHKSVRDDVLYFYAQSKEHYYLEQADDNHANILISYDRTYKGYRVRWQLDSEFDDIRPQDEMGVHDTFTKALQNSIETLKNFAFSMAKCIRCSFNPVKINNNEWMLKVDITDLGKRALRALYGYLVWDVVGHRIHVEHSIEYNYYMHRRETITFVPYEDINFTASKITNKKIRNHVFDKFYGMYWNTVVCEDRIRKDAELYYENLIQSKEITERDIERLTSIPNKDLRREITRKLVYYKLMASKVGRVYILPD